MGRPVELPFIKCWRERILTPEYTYLSEGLPSFTFTLGKVNYPPYAAVPMKSGRTGLFKLLEVDTPGDQGDMHIPRWGFIKYL